MANPGQALLDALVYAVGVTVVATLVGVLAALVAGGGLVAVKVALFLIGFALFGYASVALWRAPSLEPDEDSAENSLREPTPFESALADVVPPAGDIAPPRERFSPPVKVFVASLLVLGLSFGMEVVFGVE